MHETIAKVKEELGENINICREEGRQMKIAMEQLQEFIEAERKRKDERVGHNGF